MPKRLITLARNSANGTEVGKALIARRLAISNWVDNQLIKRLFDEIAPRFATRPGGLHPCVQSLAAHGDAAEMVLP